MKKIPARIPEFRLILLDPPNPKKIRHHLWTFPDLLMVPIPDPIGSGVARTWFGFRFQNCVPRHHCYQGQDSQYYSFNVMHIDSQRKDHGLLTQLHGSVQPHGIGNWDFNYNEEIQKSKTNFHSRSKTNKGKRSTTYYRVVP